MNGKWIIFYNKKSFIFFDEWSLFGYCGGVSFFFLFMAKSQVEFMEKSSGIHG